MFHKPILSPQALGCVLYLLCFGVHPFEDSAKLRIINANYTIPADDSSYSVFHDLIRKYHLFYTINSVPQ